MVLASGLKVEIKGKERRNMPKRNERKKDGKYVLRKRVRVKRTKAHKKGRG